MLKTYNFWLSNFFTILKKYPLKGCFSFVLFSVFFFGCISQIKAQEQKATMGEESILGKKSITENAKIAKKFSTKLKKNEENTNKNITQTLEKPIKKSRNIAENANTTLQKPELQKSENDFSNNKKNKYHNKNNHNHLHLEKKIAKKSQKNLKKRLKKHGVFQFRPFLDLNWLMVVICLVLFLGLIVGLWFLLFVITSLSLIQAILVGLSFAVAVWCFFILRTESDIPMAFYDYFVRFGLFTFFMWALLWVGLAGLFGFNVAIGSAITVGLLLGLIGFIVSLFLRKTFLHQRW